MAFLELQTPQDMLDKARREHERLSSNPNIDNVFNFFVTAYHIRDYIEKNDVIAKTEVDKFCALPDMRDCRDMCDKAKHLRLTQRPDPVTHRWSGAMGGAPMNTQAMNSNGRWELWSNDRHVDVHHLADRVLDLWNQFFHEHGL